MFNIGGSEMIVLAILALLVFGPEGLPGIIKNVMRTVNAVKIAARDFQTEVKSALEAENERQDLAQRQRTPLPPETEPMPSGPPSAAIPPMPEEHTVSPEDPSDDISELPAEVEPEAEKMASDLSDTELESPMEAEAEDDEDDDGPRVPMSRARRLSSTEEKVAETT